LSQSGTYFVVVKAHILSATSPGNCSVEADTGSFPLQQQVDNFLTPVPQAGGFFVSLSGMLVVPSGETPATTTMGCADNAGNIQPTDVSWWVSPVG
jgi:hypothetical protein